MAILDSGACGKEAQESANLVSLRLKPQDQPKSPATPPSGFSQTQRATDYVAFDRRELAQILRIYGRMVATGEWRDYAIDHLKDRAVFSIFRRSSEMPLYRIEKDPKLARKQGAYSVIAQTGLILKRGHELDNVLKVIDKSLKLVEA